MILFNTMLKMVTGFAPSQSCLLLVKKRTTIIACHKQMTIDLC